MRGDKANDGEQGRQVIYPGVLLQGGDDAQGNAKDKSYGQSHPSQVNCDRPGTADQGDHRLVGMLKRLAKIKPEHASEPGGVLLKERLVYAIAHLESGDLLFGERALTILPGSAGHLVHEHKGEHREDKENSYESKQSHQDKTKHTFLLLWL
jgi:hypothetical protein